MNNEIINLSVVAMLAFVLTFNELVFMWFLVNKLFDNEIQVFSLF